MGKKNKPIARQVWQDVGTPVVLVEEALLVPSAGAWHLLILVGLNEGKKIS
jgi:hypothetical protein